MQHCIPRQIAELVTKSLHVLVNQNTHYCSLGGIYELMKVLCLRSKLVCNITGDTINKSEEHIWKHINGKRFLNKLGESF
jgi:hypothetical protein